MNSSTPSTADESAAENAGQIPPADYWRQSRGPLASLALVSPLLVVYEVGVLCQGSHAVRNGADIWLRQWLDAVGFSQYFFLPLLTVCLLLAWQHLTAERWRLSLSVPFGMLAECAVLSLGLLVIARVQAAVFQTMLHVEGWQTAVRSTAPSLTGRLVAFVGAGIYEEVLFRLLLLPLVAASLKSLGATRVQSLAAAIVLTSLVFSAAHYVGPHGDAWRWYTFLFRLLAGGFFAALFVYRGFGISAGAHAGYDLLVGLM